MITKLVSGGQTGADIAALEGTASRQRLSRGFELNPFARIAQSPCGKGIKVRRRNKSWQSGP